MNLELFDELMKQGEPSQHPSEWKVFLEFCESYLENHKIKNPVVVELGLFDGKQKEFYKQLLGAEHIGISINSRRYTPDIRGSTHDPNTIKTLKEKLNKRPINILFIDAGHSYEDVKEDFEMYSPLCSDLIVLHDIESRRYDGPTRRRTEVWKFWDELRLEAYKGAEEYKDFLFLSIYKHMPARHRIQMGIGIMIKNE